MMHVFLHGFGLIASIIAAIALLKFLSSGGRHQIDTDGVEIFRFSPLVSWIILVFGFVVATGMAVMILLTKPTPLDAPAVGFVGGAAFFGMGLLGVYYVTLRVRVDEQSLCVSSVFGKRITHFHDIGNVTEIEPKNYNANASQRLSVTNKRGKRILYIYGTFFQDLDRLALLLKYGVEDQQHAKGHMR